jgi:putative transposase
MARGKRYQPEQVVTLLRQIEVAVANGKTTAQACKEAEIVEQTYFRWRKEDGGLQVDLAKRLKELEQENAKLKRLVAELRPGQAGVEGHRGGRLLSPEQRRSAVSHACELEPVSGMRVFCWGSPEARNAIGRHSVKMKML